MVYTFTPHLLSAVKVHVFPLTINFLLSDILALLANAFKVSGSVQKKYALFAKT